MFEKLRDKVVVIAGAPAGVGRAIARLFAQRGANLGLLARGVDGLEGAREEVEAAGRKALVVPTVVPDPEQGEAAAEEFKRVTDVTYLGYVYGTLADPRRMLPRDQGMLVQFGSALAYRRRPLNQPIAQAKHAVQGFTESLRSELIHDNSRVPVAMMQLSAINTPRFSWVKTRLLRKLVPPIYQPEVAAEAILYATIRTRRELWMGFPAVKTIVGNRLFPGYIDHYLAEHGYESHRHNGSVDPARRNNLWQPVPGDPESPDCLLWAATILTVETEPPDSN